MRSVHPALAAALSVVALLAASCDRSGGAAESRSDRAAGAAAGENAAEQPAPHTPAATASPAAEEPAGKTQPPPSSSAATAPPADEHPDASIYSPEPVVDFGEILQGEKRLHTFTVGNRGEKPIVIKAVTPTCGCTIARVRTPDGKDIDPRKVAPGTDLCSIDPGQEMKIDVEFNSRGQPLHKLQKTIMVVSSDDKLPALRLTMNMTITSAVEVDPNPVQFGQITRGQGVTKRVWIKLKRLKDLEITGVGEKPDYVDVKWQKAEAPDGGPAIALDVSLGPKLPIGYVGPTLTLKTNNKQLAEIQVQLYAMVQSEVVFDTGNKINKERIDFEVVPFGETRERVVEVQNTNPDVPFVITGVDIDSKYKDKIHVELETVKDGEHYRIHVKTAPDLDARFFRGKLLIRSKSTELPVKEIFFHGWVKKA